ncbi:MAG TPA: hypothetical protein VEW25_10435, partial [Allosphingosinicella sp.]|nr:hypothetical protein [Allosphingosinicella sp.]
MNQLAKVSRTAGRQVVELPEGFEIAGESLRVRREGRNLVLEPMPEADAIAPGFYTKDTLPPLSEKARAILASVDAAVARLDVAKAEGDFNGIEIEDAAVAIELTDE